MNILKLFLLTFVAINCYAAVPQKITNGLLTTNLNANNRQIKNMVLDKQASTPVPATEGRIIYNTTTKEALLDTGTTYGSIGGDTSFKCINGTNTNAAIVKAGRIRVNGIEYSVVSDFTPIVVSTELNSNAMNYVYYDVTGNDLEISALKDTEQVSGFLRRYVPLCEINTNNTDITSILNYSSKAFNTIVSGDEDVCYDIIDQSAANILANNPYNHALTIEPKNIFCKNGTIYNTNSGVYTSAPCESFIDNKNMTHVNLIGTGNGLSSLIREQEYTTAGPHSYTHNQGKRPDVIEVYYWDGSWVTPKNTAAYVTGISTTVVWFDFTGLTFGSGQKVYAKMIWHRQLATDEQLSMKICYRTNVVGTTRESWDTCKTGTCFIDNTNKPFGTDASFTFSPSFGELPYCMIQVNSNGIYSYKNAGEGVKSVNLSGIVVNSTWTTTLNVNTDSYKVACGIGTDFGALDTNPTFGIVTSSTTISGKGQINSLSTGIVNLSDNYNMTDSDNYSTIMMSALNKIIVLPYAANNNGRIVTFKKNVSGAGTVEIRSKAAGETIDGITANVNGIVLDFNNEWATLQSTGTLWKIIGNGGSSQLYTLTVSDTNWTTNRAIGTIYKNSLQQAASIYWFIDFNIKGTYSGNVTSGMVAIANLTFKNGSYNQAVLVITENASAYGGGFAISDNNWIATYSGVSDDVWLINGSHIELKEKPALVQ